MKKLIIAVVALIVYASCGKEFLDEKQNKKQVIPTTIADLQALLDDTDRTINSYACNELGLIGSDEYFLTDQDWNSLQGTAKPYERRGYYWDKFSVYEGESVRDWDYSYRRILYANTANIGIDKLKPLKDEVSAWNNVKGSALFIRAYAFFQLAQEFCKPYRLASANQDLGLPLRLKPDITLKTPRSKLNETYQQIISDLLTAVELLPKSALVKYRPSKAAAHALLAKTYLIMGNYYEAGKQADLSLQLENTLINFNLLDFSLDYCFPYDMQENPEILYINYIGNIPIFFPSHAKIAPELYMSYDDKDLGKQAYFSANPDGSHRFKGSYFGYTDPLFTGLCVDEVMLIKSECAARNGELNVAEIVMNKLLENRYDATKFTFLNFNSKDQALDEILAQRRKRLILRGVRWEDLRRLNQEPKYQKTLFRELNGIIHELKPGDLRYVWPIPDKAIEFGEYIQNERYF